MHEPINDWTLTAPHGQFVRVLTVHHMDGDTYAVIEDGEVSLPDKAELILLLKQLSGREIP